MIHHTSIILFTIFFCAHTLLLSLDEGSSCFWNEYPGRCVSIYKCLSSFIDAKEKIYAPICTYNGKEPIICCTDCQLVNDTRLMIIDSALGLLYKTGRKAEDGSSCFWNEYPGRCVSIYKCLSSFIDAKEKIYAPICTFNGKEPIICCTDCQLVNDTRLMIIDSALGLLYKTGRKAEDACTEFKRTVPYKCRDTGGPVYDIVRPYNSLTSCFNVTVKKTKTYYAPFLVESIDAVRAEFPHMALLGYGPDETSAQWLCGGSLISQRFILTAAHCLSHPRVGEVKYIALGILRRSDPPELWQKYNVKRGIPHPEYRPPSKYNDIALLESETDIKFGEFVRPACLHTSGDVEDTLSTTGWGALGKNRPLADNLQAVFIDRFNESDCLKHYPAHRLLKAGYDHATQMCFGDRFSVKDSCEGDSGGPLQSLNYDPHRCVFTVLGVTSAGKQCGITAGSGLYTRVQHYVPWIESLVWP